MSYTINGIGTQIYGRDKELTREDQCDQCGAFTRLTSYDATNYFVVVFIPVIPLGKIRVMDHCGSCQRWRQLPLKKWESAKEDAIRQSLQAMKANPSDPEAVKQALVTATQFQDQGVLLQFKQVAETFRSDAEVQGLLGATLSYFGRNEEAITAYETSLAAKDDLSTHEQLALEYASTAQPEKAEPHLAHIWQPDQADKVGLGIALVNGYQAKGDHQTAIAKLDRIAETHPDIAEDGEFKKIYKQAQKYERKGKPVPQLVGSSSGYKETSSSSSIAKWIFPLALAAGLALFMVFSFMAGINRKVALINGLNEPYTATIAGDEYTLQPKKVQYASIGEGQVPVSATINGIELPEETHKIKTPLFSRMFSKPLFVINPDKAAVLQKQEVIYSERGDLGDPRYEFVAGKSFYHFSDIDFQFETPPREMDLGSSRTVSKDLVDFAPVGDTEFATLSQFHMLLESEQMTTYLKQQVQLGNPSEVAIGMLIDHLEAGEMLDLLRPKLDNKPTDVAIHRAYQQAVEIATPNADLISEYKERLAKNPTDADMMYLAARLSAKEERRELLVKAINANPPSAYAYISLAFEALQAGEYKKGVPFARKAVEMKLSASFQMILAQLLEASGNFDEAMELMDDSLAGDSIINELQRLGTEIPIFVAAGKSLQVGKRIDDLVDQLDGSEMQDTLELSFRGQLAYSQGNVTELEQLMQDAPDEPPFYMLVALDRLDEAAAQFVESESLPQDLNANLTMYVAAKATANEDLAKRFLTSSIELLSKGDKDDRTIAGMLAETGQSDRDTVDEVIIWPTDKRTYLAALAFRHPEDFNHYLGLAKKLNYKRTSPYLLIKQLKPR